MIGLKNMRKLKKLTKYEITWVDIQSDDSAWMDEDQIQKHNVALCKDICYIYSRTNDKIITFSSYSYDPDCGFSYGGVNAFPTGCIKEIKKL